MANAIQHNANPCNIKYLRKSSLFSFLRESQIHQNHQTRTRQTLTRFIPNSGRYYRQDLRLKPPPPPNAQGRPSCISYSNLSYQTFGSETKL
ncbi:F-box protein [Gossypium australe]|uniref:F-box protein n=1 Tax=Gossypium australe TaxID=47621 RepID=A0A5B6VJZ3_9ROSI|nr:F-box protein [Gossypium australe]